MLPEIEETSCTKEDSMITIVDQVKFENVRKKYVCDQANPTFITAEYVMDKEIRPSTRDWIGLFPRGWNTLNTFAAFEYIVGRPYNERERKWKVSVSLKFVTEDLYHAEFQFVFVSSDFLVMGTSSFFRFYKCEADAEKAVQLYGKNLKSVIQLPEKVSEGANSPAAVEDGYPIKNVAESKRDLQNRIKTLEEKLELSIATQKKLRVMTEYEKQEKVNFQTIATTALQQMSIGTILRMNNFNSEKDFQPIYYPPSQHQRSPRSDVPTSSLLLRMKAIIGAQNEKLRIMSSEMLQMDINRNLPKTGHWEAETSRESPLYRSSDVTSLQ